MDHDITDAMSTAIMMTMSFIAIMVCIYWMYINQNHSDYMPGLWICTDRFCDDAEIDFMSIDWPNKKNPYRDIRVIVSDVCNQLIRLRYTYYSSEPYRFTIEATVVQQPKKIWPPHVSLAIDMVAGRMDIYDNNNLYATLTKQHMN